MSSHTMDTLSLTTVSAVLTMTASAAVMAGSAKTLVSWANRIALGYRQLTTGTLGAFKNSFCVIDLDYDAILEKFNEALCDTEQKVLDYFNGLLLTDP